MKQGKCPKCGSTNIFSAVDLPLKSGPFGSNSIPVSILSIAALDNWVCTDCGYLESYIAEKDKLKEIAENWRGPDAKKAAPGTANEVC